MTSYSLNGKEVSLEEFLAGAKDDWLDGPPMTAMTYRDHDPLVSEGLGCLKSQVKELREKIRQRNIKGVVIKDNGQAIITSRRGRKELLRAQGYVDNDAGYSD